MSARARIHAMFPLDEAAGAELDLRLDAYRAEVLNEAADMVHAMADPRCTCGGSDSCAARGYAKELRRKAGEKATAEAATATPDVRAVVHAALRTVQGGLHHLGLVTLEVLTDRVTEAVAPLVTSSPAPTADAEFFQPSRTYLHERLRWKFRCDAVTSHPDTGKRVAVGYSYFGHGAWQTGDLSEGIWAEGGWTDITEGGTRG